jgi:superfamily I DNA/RNA helicase
MSISGLAQLDQEQLAAVEYPTSTVCIAGPGSGKTRALISKAEYLYYEGFSDTICLTFTRAAASEIRHRTPGILAGTIHSFCHSVVGWEKDHDDLLARYIMEGKEKFQWVLVDEVQDLTPEQMEVALSLIKRGGHIFAVGDPYQSIYGYGGAMGSEAIDVLKGSGCQTFELRNNYRSTQGICDKLNTIYSRGTKSVGTNENGITSILCRSNDAVLSASELLKDHKIGHSVRRQGRREIGFFGSNGIKISTIHKAKGLEFSNVILHGWQPRRRSKWVEIDEEMNVYYVAVSRTVSGYAETFAEFDLVMQLESFIPDLYKKHVYTPKV